MRCFAFIIMMLLVAVCAGSVAAQDLSLPGPYAGGWRSVTVSRPDATTLTARVYYPAVAAGQNAVRDETPSPSPGVSFGHGFFTPVSSYQSTLLHLATHGYIVIASESEGGLFPSHARFAADISTCLTFLTQQGGTPGSWLAGAVDADRLGVCGHSMGGGACMLAGASDGRVKGVIPLAPAETNPSAVSAAGALSMPTTIIVGTQHTIVPTASNGQLMFNALPGARRLLSISGGFHCGFIDANSFGCDSVGMARAEQLAIVRGAVTAFCDLHLRGDQSRAALVWDPAMQSDARVAVTLDANLTIEPPGAPVAVVPRRGQPVTMVVSNTGPVGSQVSVLGGSAWITVPSDPIVLAAGASAGVEGVLRVPDGIGLPTMVSVGVCVRGVDNARAYASFVVSAECSSDFNGDGDFGTDQDIEAFFACLGGHCCASCGSADFNGDGDTGTDQDIEAFFRALAGGAC